MNLEPFMEDEEGVEVAVREHTQEFMKLPEADQALVLTAAIEYETMNQQEKLIEERRNKIFRPIVESAADLYGSPDENEHLHLVAAIDNVDVEIIRTKKTSRTLNELATEELLKSKGLYESCVMQVITYEIDEEKIIEAYDAGLISANELDSLFYSKVSWATSVKVDTDNIKLMKKLRKRLKDGEDIPQKEMKLIESSG
jgi:hypothetical protein